MTSGRRGRHPDQAFSNTPNTSWDPEAVRQAIAAGRRELRNAQRDELEAKVLILTWEDWIAEAESVLKQIADHDAAVQR